MATLPQRLDASASALSTAHSVALVAAEQRTLCRSVSVQVGQSAHHSGVCGLQTGVVRTMCIDLEEGSNVVQAMIGRCVRGVPVGRPTAPLYSLSLQRILGGRCVSAQRRASVLCADADRHAL